ncbi:MAG TPA: cation transporting ATPase C-terminal domain-containing protein, partial [Polyangiaceae bacterium]|nr:cation transporting ATPase C-terminal domain-containing protein [Polyangiaceae bacterium]
VMRSPPSPKAAPLLDPRALRFIAMSGALHGAFGLGLLLVLPRFGLTVVAIQTLVFLYEASAKLVSVYPARRLGGETTPNRALRLALALGLVLIAACFAVPPLRTALALTLPTPLEVLCIALSVVVTWAIAELVVLRSGTHGLREPRPRAQKLRRFPAH